MHRRATRPGRYHIVPGSTLFSALLTDGKLLTTSLPGAAPLRVSKRGSAVVITASGSEAARLTAPADVRLCHGALHGVDTVLLPSDRGADVAMLG
jgi:hypothetical protein